MLQFKAALQQVLSTTRDFGTEAVSLSRAEGRILKEVVRADRDFPPYNRVAMDGIAINYAAFETGRRSFRIESIAAAGSPQQSLSSTSHCIEIMTGAVCPKGADTVIRYEDIEIDDGAAHIQISDVKPGQHVHLKGLDKKKDTTLIESGTKLTAAEIAVCATVGKTELKVAALPQTVILSSGDELVEVQDTPLPHQIRRSNVHAMAALLKHYQIKADTRHLPDIYKAIKLEMAEVLDNYDVVLLSGGVSKGKMDYLPEVLDDLGVRKLFHKVEQRPGKPFWFGLYKEKTAIFALPGNPVSAFVGTRRYVFPWLDKCMQLNRSAQPMARLADDFRFSKNLTYFLPVKTHYSKAGQLIANPMKGQGSGDLANLVRSDGFVELPADKDVFKAGEVYPYFSYRFC